MFNEFYILIGNMFFKLKQLDNGSEWVIIKSSVCVKLLNELYYKFLKDEITPIEQLQEDKKWHYYNIACKFYNTKEQRVKASKAAYVLSLITSED